ncbi:MAG: hypothetical protein CMJ18_05175 [Phycisphaeraceae bacterium]|nr:hypothetical protein [Phycisphaeraceae bacterium]
MDTGTAQRNAFVKDGYVVVPDLIGPEALAELDRMADRLLDGELKPQLPYEGHVPDHFYTFWEPAAEGRSDLPRRDRVRLMANMCRHHPYFRALVRHPAIYRVLSCLFGTGVRVFSDSLFMKPARHGIEAAMHQDTAFWPKIDPNAINFWLAIDPATVENGCLHVIPGTHGTDLPHRDDPVQGHVLSDKQVDVGRLIPLEMEPGSAVFFDSSLVHRSRPNHSARSRRAYAVVYGAETLRHVEPWNINTIAEATPSYEFELIEPPVGS